jgi:hypothetical protein
MVGITGKKEGVPGFPLVDWIKFTVYLFWPSMFFIPIVILTYSGTIFAGYLVLQVAWLAMFFGAFCSIPQHR